MSKKGRTKTPIVNRRALSRREREQRYERRLYLAAGVVVALILGVIGYGLVQHFVVAPAAPVATVNGVPIRTDTYQRYVRYQRYQLNNYLLQVDQQLAQFDPTDETLQFLVSYLQQQRSQIVSEINNLATTAPLEQLIADELIRQEAKRRNIVVTPEEVQKEIEQSFGYNLDPVTPAPTAEPSPSPAEATPEPTLTPEPTPTPMTEERFQELFAKYVQDVQKSAGLNEAGLRSMVSTQLLRTKLQEAMGAEVTTTAEQVHARHILVDEEEQAKAALERIQKGEDFAKVAEEVSTDTMSKEQGGDLGWFPRGQMLAEFDEAAFALQPGQVSDVVQTYYGYHIIKVEEHEAERPLDESALAQKRSGALEEWLKEQVADGQGIKRFWSSDMVPK